MIQYPCLHLRDRAVEAGFTVSRAGWCEHTGQPPRDHIAELQAQTDGPVRPVPEPDGR